MARLTIRPVLVSIVTWNSQRYLDACLESLQAQTVPLTVRIFDNASSDGTVEVARRHGVPLVQSPQNVGFCRGHNQVLDQNDFDFALVLNPDVILGSTYIELLVRSLQQYPRVGTAGGKLYRMDDAGKPILRSGRPVLDSTGMYMTPSQRHFDRGQGEIDSGRYDRAQFVFGITGAALLCRWEMLQDIRTRDEIFDEDFFAYREDADLAWRAQLRGWKALYLPEATAWHRRQVVPEGRRAVEPLINYHSVKNRFLMRRKNADWAVRLRCFPFASIRDLGALAYMLLVERSSLPALRESRRLRARMDEKRQTIQWARRVSPSQMARWFRFRPVAEELR